MGRTACTEPQCLYKGALYFTLVHLVGFIVRICHVARSHERQSQDCGLAAQGSHDPAVSTVELFTVCCTPTLPSSAS